MEEVSRVAGNLKSKGGSIPFIYMGLPVGSTMRKKKDWVPILEKFKSRLSDWSAKCLSYGGRLTLIKSVLGGLANYYFSLFRAPSNVIQSLERLRKNFFWGGGDGKTKRLSWVKWDHILSPYKSGGLGIGSLKGHNLALLGKWWWRFKTRGNTLWTSVIKSIYGFEGGLSLGEAVRGHVRSIWGDIIRTGAQLERLGFGWERGFQKKVGSGESTFFWQECWVGDISFKNRFPRLYSLERNKDVRVCERWCVNSNRVNWQWDWVRLPRGRSMNELEELIRTVENVSLCADKEDAWRWAHDRHGDFSVSSLRKLIEDKVLVDQSHANSSPTVWNRLLPKKVCIFIWRTLKGRLPVRVSLDNRGIDLGSTLCPRCGNEPESLLHCLIRCPISTAIWKEVFTWWGWSDFIVYSVNDLLMHKGKTTFPPGVSIVWQAVLWVSAYHIWKSRNEWVFRKKQVGASMISILIKIQAFNWITRRWKHGALSWQDWSTDPTTAATKLLVS